MSPFGYGRGEGVDAGHGDPEWICSKEKPRYDQLFQSLNPIDGKVTGAGTHPSRSDIRTLSLLLNTQPHLRGHLLVDRALEALLSTTQNCSLITDLCMRLKDSENDKDDDSFARLVDSLSSSTENCKLIAQFIMNAREPQVAGISGRVSAAVSIHSLGETLAIDGAGDRCESSQSRYLNEGLETKASDRSKVHSGWNAESVDKSDDSVDDSCSESESESASLDVIVPERTGYFRSLFIAVKFIVLLSLNIVTLLITAEFLFMSLVYALTGERHVELRVERAPRCWLERARLAAFGPEQQAVRIKSFVELFYRDNVVHILKYLTEKLTSSIPM